MIGKLIQEAVFRDIIVRERAVAAYAGLRFAFANAVILSACSAHRALSAIISRIDHDPVAGPKRGDVRADAHHFAGGFVTKDGAKAWRDIFR